MKKTPILNREISHAVACMGHGDLLGICDAGLPIPSNVNCIDVSVSANTPNAMSVINAISSELFVEKIFVASEMQTHNPPSWESVIKWVENLSLEQGKKIELVEISHGELKSRSHKCRALVRTGECTPFFNVLIQSGVTF